MATAHFDAESLYEAVEADDNDEDAPVLVVKKGGTRGADWVKCWKVMRKLDKFSAASGAAATAAAARGRRPLPDGGLEDISDDNSSSTVGRRRGLFHERPIGTKAAKAAAATDVAIQREGHRPQTAPFSFQEHSTFSSSIVAVGRLQMTGNLTDEDLIRMATAHFDAESLYEAVQADDNDEDAPVLVVKKGGTRGADLVKC